MDSPASRSSFRPQWPFPTTPLGDPGHAWYPKLLHLRTSSRRSDPMASRARRPRRSCLRAASSPGPSPPPPGAPQGTRVRGHLALALCCAHLGRACRPPLGRGTRQDRGTAACGHQPDVLLFPELLQPAFCLPSALSDHPHSKRPAPARRRHSAADLPVSESGGHRCHQATKPVARTSSLPVPSTRAVVTLATLPRGPTPRTSWRPYRKLGGFPSPLRHEPCPLRDGLTRL